ncbi:TadE family type IV pilus minor pilin [Prescottella equi]|uniref:TadE family type IV pilus minor pilin n=1 Tax=Rhodococcus hoagii TaxID=43767 RepID=UPI000D0FF611|nr:TadE family type IV pilus minor pilin [Prescottella equi]AVP66975.1 pilus assembly protein TadE [Prescottella equi]MBM4524877.1 pilus assembly protein TadE [Prescottella equi]MBM4650683.1 pilus assembly protein TadE [Prescottella equi]MBM4683774.1 pilus assembly protein TadE [Prescottella equi]
MTGRPGPRGDTGAVTVEAAIAIASIVTVVVLCIGAIVAVSTQVRCIDAAREAARLAARGDRPNAAVAAGRVAPHGAEIEIRDDGAFVVATVRARATLLPVVELSAESVAVKEPEQDSG